MTIRRIETTYAVYRTLLEAHQKELGVYESFSNPDGMAFGGGGAHGEMRTVWGFRNMNCKLLEARTTWDIEWVAKMGELRDTRVNEQSQYWLYVGEEDEAQD